MKLRSHCICTAVVAATLMLPLSASAQGIREVFMPTSGGKMVLGTIFGEPWAGFQPPGGGRCTWFDLGNSNGLTNDIYVRGSVGKDVVWSAVGTLSHCGFSMTPVVMNGHIISLDGGNHHGGTGDDFLAGKANFISGYDGDDIIVGNAGIASASLKGGDDDDILFGYGSENLRAEGGDDTLCGSSSSSGFFNGGPGSDVGCGSPRWVSSVTMKSKCPSKCNLF
ncbi:MAG: hypothetical protein OXU20_22620 [Myxococcales bacterium]|nr:hypothetical protein [Myxococcales bacterium]MDD9967672.1 hypothetical protein [Myxococcales bacterium]